MFYPLHRCCHGPPLFFLRLVLGSTASHWSPTRASRSLETDLTPFLVPGSMSFLGGIPYPLEYPCPLGCPNTWIPYTPIVSHKSGRYASTGNVFLLTMQALESDHNQIFLCVNIFSTLLHCFSSKFEVCLLFHQNSPKSQRWQHPR